MLNGGISTMTVNTAEYMREYRAKRKLANDPVARGSKSGNGHRETKFERAEFIAWDGEGITSDIPIDDSTNEHYFIMLANSVGDCIRAEQKRLGTLACFRMLLDCAMRYPRAIHVVYGGSYDMNCMLYDLPRNKATELAKEGSVIWKGFFIQFYPRRSLTIRYRGVSITLWDVVGFFQMKFEKAVVQWLGKDYPGLAIISEGKLKRTEFQHADLDFMQKYNNAELEALVQIMQRFHNAVDSLGLCLSRWDGAGSIAAAILKKKGFKKSLPPETPQAVELAARHAYFGGRFELGQYGIHEGESYGYDINSAYPSVFRTMPNLSVGRWTKIDTASANACRRITPFSLVHIRWNLPRIRYGPFPYRNHNGLVIYPVNGENWVWGSEYLAYLDTIPDRPDWEVELVEAWVFTPYTKELPFEWVDEYYHQRQEIVNGTSNLPYGAQMVLKLGLNSLYGKTAQSLGYQPERQKLPPFHCLLYAGYITATTRAMLWKATMQAPDSIIMLATDGILSTTPLDLPISSNKELGYWEKSEYDLICAIQSGVYITGHKGEYKFKKRGLDSDDDVSVFLNGVKRHWADKDSTYTKLNVPQTRLIGLKTAISSDEFWNRRASWYHHSHQLLMHPGPQTKRLPDKKSPHMQPDTGLVQTIPMMNILYTFGKVMSKAYERPWDREKWRWNDEEELHEVTDFIYA
jgi:hypothetical protein